MAKRSGLEVWLVRQTTTEILSVVATSAKEAIRKSRQLDNWLSETFREGARIITDKLSEDELRRHMANHFGLVEAKSECHDYVDPEKIGDLFDVEGEEE